MDVAGYLGFVLKSSTRDTLTWVTIHGVTGPNTKPADIKSLADRS